MRVFSRIVLVKCTGTSILTRIWRTWRFLTEITNPTVYASTWKGIFDWVRQEMIDVLLTNPDIWYYSCCKNSRNKNIFTTIKTWGGGTGYSSLSGNNMMIIKNFYSKNNIFMIPKSNFIIDLDKLHERYWKCRSLIGCHIFLYRASIMEFDQDLFHTFPSWFAITCKRCPINTANSFIQTWIWRTGSIFTGETTISSKTCASIASSSASIKRTCATIETRIATQFWDARW